MFYDKSQSPYIQKKSISIFDVPKFSSLPPAYTTICICVKPVITEHMRFAQGTYDTTQLLFSKDDAVCRVKKAINNSYKIWMIAHAYCNIKNGEARAIVSKCIAAKIAHLYSYQRLFSHLMY